MAFPLQDRYAKVFIGYIEIADNQAFSRPKTYNIDIITTVSADAINPNAIDFIIDKKFALNLVKRQIIPVLFDHIIEVNGAPVAYPDADSALAGVNAILFNNNAGSISNLDVPLSTRASESTQLANKALLTSIDGKDFATETTLNALLTYINTFDFATSAKQDTGNASLASIAAEDFATETTLNAIKTFLSTVLNVNLSTLATESTLSTISALLASRLDVALSTRNAETTQLLIKAKTDNLDIALSALLSGIRGAGTKDFTTLQTSLEARVNTLGQKAMAASTPVVIASDQSTYPVTINTLTQAPQSNSVGLYTAAEKVFMLSIALNQATGGADNPLILFSNPNGSGKTAYIAILKANTNVTNVFSTFKIFGSPTITANGTAQTPRNGKITGATVSAMNVYSLPTISANGNERASATAGQNSSSEIVTDSYQIAVPPNASMLITGNPASNNRAAQLTLVWIEI